ncbi:MAG: hypothetical protein ACRCYD_10060 [Plesiomonas sp.]
MKKGQKVKCVSTNNGYLTVGKIYPVLATCGDMNQSVYTKGMIPVLEHELFNIADDSGDPLLCVYPQCCHAEWELVDA